MTSRVGFVKGFLKNCWLVRLGKVESTCLYHDIWLIFMVNVGKYASPMDCLGGKGLFSNINMFLVGFFWFEIESNPIHSYICHLERIDGATPMY